MKKKILDALVLGAGPVGLALVSAVARDIHVGLVEVAPMRHALALSQIPHQRIYSLTHSSWRFLQSTHIT